uniref:DNA cross-link repair 1A protein n=1 Tax=Neogobius melanostomus TaxID=47308 RepID=A0A8C6TNK7_9GOBI
MSQNDDSENDIWNYKPLKKKKKQESPCVPKTVAKRRSIPRGTNKGPSPSSAPSSMTKINLTTSTTSRIKTEQVPQENCVLNTLNTPSKASSTFDVVQNSGDYCPVCQIPFSILVVQSQRHVIDCLDFCRDTCTECPDGLLCSSTIPKHFVTFNHTLLAQSRAKGDVPLSETTSRITNQFGPIIAQLNDHSGPVNSHVDQPDDSALKTSQDNFPIHPLLSSPHNNHTKSPKIPNGLLLLRSPAPGDFKKKKGWSSPKVQNSNNDTAEDSKQSGSIKQSKTDRYWSVFGLKPLKDKETKNEVQEPQLSVNERQKQEAKTQKGQQKKGHATARTEGSQSAATTVENGTGGETKKAWAKGWRRRRTDGDVEKYPRCPFYKKIPGTKLVVDAFRYGPIEGITAYFLTHFHSDHYQGLTKNSTLPIYCNKITGNLVKSKLKVPEQYVHILPMNTEVTVEGVKVILLDANHCPGAAMLLLVLPDRQTVLHTGDFRADTSMETLPELLSCRVQTLYLDTTYCSPEYTFPQQQEVINYAANTAFELVTLKPRTLVVCGSYSVGRRRSFWVTLADVLGSKVCLSRDKFNTMCCLESEEVTKRITTDWKSAQVHVLPMMQLSFKKLQDHLARYSAKYDKLVAFKPTGWTFSQQVESVEDIAPQVNGNISIYGIPYSEHSSFLELKRFVQWLRPVKIIPTVNNGRWESRKAMERCFSDWLKEPTCSRAKL